jgi:hypothetical protein
VYKFLPAAFALENLKKHRIKISEFSDMNDPFELRGVALSSPDAQSALISSASSICGVLCFSRNWNNLMLWSHYADRHKGICLGFDVRVPVEEILYIDEPELRDDNILVAAAARARELSQEDDEFQAAESVLTKMRRAKFKGWSYEEEVRLLLGLQEEQKDGEFYFAELDENIRLTTVIVGPRCAVQKSEIEVALRSYAEPITVFWTTLSPRSFTVIEDTRGFGRG